LRQRDGGSVAGGGADFEVVDEATRARQTQTKPVARGVTIAQGRIDVGDARAVISRQREHADSGWLAANPEQDFAASTVDDGVAGDLGDRDCQCFDGGGVQSVSSCDLANPLPCGGDVGVFAERQTEQDFAS
jgi:hypothetical protein